MESEKKDKKKFSELILKHQRIIHKIVHIYAIPVSEKEDLFQEICLQLWKSYNSFQSKAQFSTWLYRVSLNTAISYFRKNNSKPKFIPLNKNHYKASVPNDNHGIQQSKKLLKAINHLKNIDKAIILLWLESKSYFEIAEILGISSGNVSVKLVRIKKQLEKFIHEEEEFYE